MSILLSLFLIAICSRYVIGLKGPVAEMGPINAVDFQSIGQCSFKNTLKSSLKISLNKDPKSFTGEMSLPFDFDESTRYQIVMHKYLPNGSLKKNAFKTEGLLCDHANKFIKPVLKAYMAALEPKASGNCAIKKGSYKFKNVQASIKDISVPNFPYGKFKGEIRIMSGKDVAFCIESVTAIS